MAGWRWQRNILAHVVCMERRIERISFGLFPFFPCHFCFFNLHYTDFWGIDRRVYDFYFCLRILHLASSSHINFFSMRGPWEKTVFGWRNKKKQSTIMTVHNLCIIPMGFPCCHVSLISSFSSRSNKLICLGAGREIKYKDLSRGGREMTHAD